MSNLLVLVVHRLGHKRMPTTWTTTNSTQLAPEGFIYVQKKWLVTRCFVFLFVFFLLFSWYRNTLQALHSKTPDFFSLTVTKHLVCVRVSDLPPVYTEVELLHSGSVCLILNTGVRLWIRTEAEGNRWTYKCVFRVDWHLRYLNKKKSFDNDCS